MSPARMPGYWRYETGGELGPAVERLLNSHPLTERDVALIRAYFCQWVDSPIWDTNPSLDAEGRAALKRVRSAAAAIRTAKDIQAFIPVALDIGMDPL